MVIVRPDNKKVNTKYNIARAVWLRRNGIIFATSKTSNPEQLARQWLSVKPRNTWNDIALKCNTLDLLLGYIKQVSEM